MFSKIVYARCIVFNCYYPFIAICWQLGSTSYLLSSIWMTPPDTYLSLGFSGLMVSIVPYLVALFSGAKTLGWDTQKLF
jgi:hypothetical protein